MKNKKQLIKDFKSLLPDGSEGWLIKKYTKVNIIEMLISESLVEYIDYSFYVPNNLLKPCK